LSLEKTLVLGFIAGATILLGLPIGRLKRPAPALRMMLNAVAVGILLFLVWDVLSAAWEPIDAALRGFLKATAALGVRSATAPCSRVACPSDYSRSSGTKWMDRVTGDPTATLVDDPMPRFRSRLASWSFRRGSAVDPRGDRVAQLRRGLAIGQAAAKSEIALATLLVIGFALHSDQGFGIIRRHTGGESDSTLRDSELGTAAPVQHRRCSSAPGGSLVYLRHVVGDFPLPPSVILYVVIS
jgi:ZIP family zinc transporter